MKNKERGIYDKYKVTRTDGRDQNDGDRSDSKYFVIDLTHDKFAHFALLIYANMCEKEYPKLANDLRELCKDEKLQFVCEGCFSVSESDDNTACDHCGLLFECSGCSGCACEHG